MLSLCYPFLEFLECRSVFVSNFNSITCIPGYIYGPRLWIGKHPASSQTLCAFLVRFLLSHRFEIMENSKRFIEEALNGAASSCQLLHHQEGVTHDALTASGHRVNSVQPSRFSSSIAHHQLPYYPRRWVDNDDLLTSIDRHGQNLVDCLSLVESALAMVR